jgi:dCMP deaminase
MRVAEEAASMSYAKRLKVGAVAVKDHRIISIGYNGTPPGWNNECEVKEYLPDSPEFGLFNEKDYPHFDRETLQRYRLVTKPEVIHAEENCILKMARDGQSALGCDLFVTVSPCFNCARSIATSGVKRVFFKDQFRDTKGVDFLSDLGVEVEHIF